MRGWGAGAGACIGVEADLLHEVKPASGVLKLTPAMELVLQAARSMRSIDYDVLSQKTNLGIAEVMAAVCSWSKASGQVEQKVVVNT